MSLSAYQASQLTVAGAIIDELIAEMELEHADDFLRVETVRAAIASELETTQTPGFITSRADTWDFEAALNDIISDLHDAAGTSCRIVTSDFGKYLPQSYTQSTEPFTNAEKQERLSRLVLALHNGRATGLVSAAIQQVCMGRQLMAQQAQCPTPEETFNYLAENTFDIGYAHIVTPMIGDDYGDKPIIYAPEALMVNPEIIAAHNAVVDFVAENDLHLKHYSEGMGIAASIARMPEYEVFTPETVAGETVHHTRQHINGTPEQGADKTTAIEPEI